MVKICRSMLLFSSASALEDAEAMLQVGKGPALVQTAQTGRSSSSHQAFEMEYKFEKLAEDAVRSGDTPSLGAEALEAVNAALDVLETQLSQEEKTANEGDVSRANDAVKQCNAHLDTAMTDILAPGGFKQTMMEAKSTHSTCRSLEDEHRRKEKQDCDEKDRIADQSHSESPKCACEGFDEAKKTLQCVRRAEEWGEKFYTQLDTQIKECDAIASTAAETATTCDADQRRFEVAFCGYDVKVSAACSAKESCYELQKKNFEQVVVDTKLKVAAEKIMWKSVKKVRCYIDLLDATSQVSQEKYDTCKGLDIDTDLLNIDYPNLDPEGVCELVAARPGDEAWAVGDLSGYASLPEPRDWLADFHGVESVTSCHLRTIVSPIKSEAIVTAEPEAIVIADENGYSALAPGTSYQKPAGSDCCAEEDQIQSLEDCQAAHDALGLRSDNVWTGLQPNIPGQCSWRDNSNGDNFHWNTFGGCGKAHPWFVPICKRR